MTIGINLPLEVAFNVVPNSSELGWTWADTSGGAQSWNFHDGDAAQHAQLRINIQFWNGTTWSASRTLRTWTSGWENLPPEYTQGSPFDVGNYLTEIGWSGVSSQPLIKVTFWNLLNNGADGNVNLTAGESPLVYLWNTEDGTVDRLSTTGPELVLNGDATTTVVQGQEYSDLGATAYDLDGAILSTTTSGDVVNSNDPINTEFVVLISATSNVTGVSSEIDRIVTVVSATEDTSDEDDSSPDNGDAQNMEENIMSKFTFGNRYDLDSAEKASFDNVYLTPTELVSQLQDMIDTLSQLAPSDPANIPVHGRYAVQGFPVYQSKENILSDGQDVALLDENGDFKYATLQDALLDTNESAIAVLRQAKMLWENATSFYPSNLPVDFGYFANGVADVHTETTTSKSGKDYLGGLKTMGIQSCEDINIHGDLVFDKNGDTFAFGDLITEVQFVHGVFIKYGPLVDENGDDAGYGSWNIVEDPEEINNWQNDVFFQPIDPSERGIKTIRSTDVGLELMHGVFNGTVTPPGEGFVGDSSVDFARTSINDKQSGDGRTADSLNGSRQLDGTDLLPASSPHLTPSHLTPFQAEGVSKSWSEFGVVTEIPLQNQKWYLRNTMADGSVRYSEFKPVNDLVSQVGELGSVYSVLAGMRSIKDLQDAARYMFAELGLASIDAIDDLEDKMTADMLALMQHINHVEVELGAYIKREDERIAEFALERIDDLADEVRDLESAIRFTGEAQIEDGNIPEVLSFTAELGSKMQDSDLACWKFDVSAIVNGVARGDIEAQFEARFVDMPAEEGEAVLKGIKVDVFSEGCVLMDDVNGDAISVVPTLRVNAIYAGTIDNKVSNNPKGETTEAEATPDLPLALNQSIGGADDLRKIDDLGTAGVGDQGN